MAGHPVTDVKSRRNPETEWYRGMAELPFVSECETEGFLLLEKTLFCKETALIM